MLEWVAKRSSKGSSWPRDWTWASCGSCIAGGFFTAEPPGRSLLIIEHIKKEIHGGLGVSFHSSWHSVLPLSNSQHHLLPQTFGYPKLFQFMQFKKYFLRDFPVRLWLRIHLLVQGMQFRSLVRKLRSHMLQGNWAHAAWAPPWPSASKILHTHTHTHTHTNTKSAKLLTGTLCPWSYFTEKEVIESHPGLACARKTHEFLVPIQSVASESYSLPDYTKMRSWA